MSDLGNWHAFERANSDTLLGMYQFWRRATSPGISTLDECGEGRRPR